jgi:hypothetical protein
MLEWFREVGMFFVIFLVAAAVVAFLLALIVKLWRTPQEPLGAKVAGTVVLLGTIGLYVLAIWLFGLFG